MLCCVVFLRKKPTSLFADYDEVEGEIRDEHCFFGGKSSDVRTRRLVKVFFFWKSKEVL